MAEWWIVLNHGTAGWGASEGYSEVRQGPARRDSATETWIGPFETRGRAEIEMLAYGRVSTTERR